MRIGPIRPFIWLLLGLLCAVSFTLNLVVIAYDDVGDVYDSMHLERTGRLLAHAAEGDARAWHGFRAAVTASAYPELIHYITLPVRLMTGDHARSGAVAVAAWALVALLATFGLGNLLGGDRVGLVAAFFLACSPGFYRFSRLETTDLPLVSMLTLSVYLLLRGDGLGQRGLALLFGAVASLSVLTKQSFILYMALPFGYAFAQELWLDSPVRRRVRLRNAGLAAAIFGAVIVAVYFPDLDEWTASRQAVRSFYLTVDQIGFIDNLKLLITGGWGPILAALVFAGLLLCSRKDRAIRVLLLWLAPPLLILHAVFGMLSTRYLLPLLPAGAVLAALGLEKIIAHGLPRRRAMQLAIVVLVLIAAVVHDHLREDQTAFTFASFEKRQHLEGIPRPTRLGWSVRPVVRRLADQAGGKKIVMLLDSPYTSLLQGTLWLRDPLLEIDNLFERAAAGRMPAEFAPADALTDYLRAADFVLIKSGFNTDVRNYNFAQDVNPKFAQRVFDAFFTVKQDFELVDHFPYPESPSPVLLYRRKLSVVAPVAKPPGQSPPELHTAPDPAT